jgi:hypothetical protein
MVTHGLHKTVGTAVVIAVDRVVWFTPDTTGGRLKAPLRMLPDAEVNMRIKFEQRGDTILRLTRVP